MKNKSFVAFQSTFNQWIQLVNLCVDSLLAKKEDYNDLYQERDRLAQKMHNAFQEYCQKSKINRLVVEAEQQRLPEMVREMKHPKDMTAEELQIAYNRGKQWFNEHDETALTDPDRYKRALDRMELIERYMR